MIAFKFEESLACTRLHEEYWRDRNFTNGAIAEWFEYARGEWGIEPDHNGTGTWYAVDSEKYLAFLLRWA